jgi:hypothetical protein
MNEAPGTYEVCLVPRHEEDILNEIKALLDDDETRDGCAELLAQLAAITSGDLDGTEGRYVHTSSGSWTIYCMVRSNCAAYYAYGVSEPARIYWLGFCRAHSRFRFYPTAGERHSTVP